MNRMNTPGFTAEAALHRMGNHYHSVATRSSNSEYQGVVSEMNARGAGGPFSGSCECGEGYCCCILCYFENCYFWCWSTARLSIGY